MPTPQETVEQILKAETLDKRVAQIRLVPQHHGTGQYTEIFAAVARALYIPQLAPDFAYIHGSHFYDENYFRSCYQLAIDGTEGFAKISEDDLTRLLRSQPRALLPLRTILGLTQDEFAHSTVLAAAPLNLPALSASKVDSMERKGSAATENHARVAARAITQIMAGDLFGEAPPGLLLKQAKPDTASGWKSVEGFATKGVDYGIFLHQRHYGGAFRQILDATSSRRGDTIEDAVAALFKTNKIPHIRTGSHDQAEIAARFEIKVTPAPDFVVFDNSGTLKGMLECKGTNNGGTARDKALRFDKLHEESRRLGGVPLLAVLGGIGWARVNDALAPVIQKTDGRVFTTKTLDSMLTVAPFPSLIGLAKES